MSQLTVQQAYDQLNPIRNGMRPLFQSLLQDQYPAFVNHCIDLNEACKEGELLHGSLVHNYLYQIKEHIFRPHIEITLKKNIMYALDWYEKLASALGQNAMQPSLIYVADIKQALHNIQNIVFNLTN